MPDAKQLSLHRQRNADRHLLHAAFLRHWNVQRLLLALSRTAGDFDEVLTLEPSNLFEDLYRGDIDENLDGHTLVTFLRMQKLCLAGGFLSCRNDAWLGRDISFLH